MPDSHDFLTGPALEEACEAVFRSMSVFDVIRGDTFNGQAHTDKTFDLLVTFAGPLERSWREEPSGNEFRLEIHPTAKFIVETKGKKNGLSLSDCRQVKDFVDRQTLNDFPLSHRRLWVEEIYNALHGATQFIDQIVADPSAMGSWRGGEDVGCPSIGEAFFDDILDDIKGIAELFVPLSYGTKGVLVINQQNPTPIPPNVADFAKTHSVALLRWSELLEIQAAIQAGDVHVMDVFSLIFDTGGEVCGWREHRPPVGFSSWDIFRAEHARVEARALGPNLLRYSTNSVKIQRNSPQV